MQNMRGRCATASFLDYGNLNACFEQDKPSCLGGEAFLSPNAERLSVSGQSCHVTSGHGHQLPRDLFERIGAEDTVAVLLTRSSLCYAHVDDRKGELTIFDTTQFQKDALAPVSSSQWSMFYDTRRQ